MDSVKSKSKGFGYRSLTGDFVTNFRVEGKKFSDENEALKYGRRESKDKLRSVIVEYRDDMSSPWMTYALFRNGNKES